MTSAQWVTSERFDPEDRASWKRFGTTTAGELFLYRLTTPQRYLLYVGITWHPFARFSQHRRDKTWWGEVFNVDLWRGPECEMRAAETRVIKTQAPIHNIQQSVRGGIR